MTRDDLYKFICDTNDADPVNMLIAIDKALTGEIGLGDLHKKIVIEMGPEWNRRRDDQRPEENSNRQKN